MVYNEKKACGDSSGTASANYSVSVLFMVNNRLKFAVVFLTGFLFLCLPSISNAAVLDNPIGIDTFEELVDVIGTWIFNLAIPIAVIVIIYAGILMLTAGGNPGKFQKGAKALWYAVLGLAIIFIGKGFVTLIESILSLRNP